MKPNEVFTAYVVHSFIYYIMCDVVITDYDFDALGRRLSKVYDDVTHPDKELVDPDYCGYTGLDMPEVDYPAWVEEMAILLGGRR